VPRQTLRHLLHHPEKFGNKRLNRDALPRRQETLVLGPSLQFIGGWGLHFVEKVWDTPIRIAHFGSIGLGILCLIVWSCTKEPQLGTVLSAPVALGLGQSIVTLMEKWAESNLQESA
jgi:hypothetical protein